jgi:hypothetical protein
MPYTPEQAAAILAEGRERIASLEQNRADLAEREARNGLASFREREDERLAKARAASPPRRERGLDTDLTALIDQRVTKAVAELRAERAEERALLMEVIGEDIGKMLDVDRQNAIDDLERVIRDFNFDMDALRETMKDLRATFASESARVLDLPPRAVN